MILDFAKDRPCEYSRQRNRLPPFPVEKISAHGLSNALGAYAVLYKYGFSPGVCIELTQHPRHARLPPSSD